MADIEPTTTSNEEQKLEQEQQLQARSYQREMLWESMQRNIIVAADTGSGKTLIAILRMQAELERCPSSKLVWFCVPTVALVMQQHKAISAQLPAYQSRVLSGADNVEFWTEQWIWDEILKGIRIVVSTHQILLDALIHGFVRMQQLALIVFDEAHSCIGNHPSSRILLDFYHKSNTGERPTILGLTASPVINSKVGNLGTLESNLNAISRTPKLHRDEMLKFVHRPKMVPLEYSLRSTELIPSLALESLGTMYKGLDIEQDPWIIKQKSDPSTAESPSLRKAMLSHKTYCHDQIKGLYDRAIAIATELGSSAADYYIHQCIKKFQRGPATGSFMIELEDTERLYLHKKFDQVQIPNQDTCYVSESQFLAPKVKKLIEFLKAEDPTGFSGLIFVRTRAEVAVLSHILSLHVPVFAISTFVGASSFSGRKNTVGELADIRNQKDTLDDLRHGKSNLIVTTNALEEGIDVAKCNVVVCFERPPNLKSFVQRRGRARKDTSRYVMMFENDGSQSDFIATLLKLEEEMRNIYMDDMRKLSELQASEDIEEGGQRELNTDTGAKLTLDDGVRHLYHFCATLPAAPYTDMRPIFTFEGVCSDGERKAISAKVTLPNSVDISVREAHSASTWKTEKMARRDAAFEAYAALYRAGLINNNFLPLGHVDATVDEAYSAIEKRPSVVEVPEQLNPWLSVAQEWQDCKAMATATIEIKQDGQCIAEMLMLLPRPIPSICQFNLYWDGVTTYQTTCKPNLKGYDLNSREAAAQVTNLLLRSQYPNKMEIDRSDLIALFVPLGVDDLHAWAHEHSGSIKGEDLLKSDVQANNAGLVRDLSENGRPYTFRGVQYASSEDADVDGAMETDQHGSVPQAHSTGVEKGDRNHERSRLGAPIALECHQIEVEASSHGSPQNVASDDHQKLVQYRNMAGVLSKGRCMGSSSHINTVHDDMDVDEYDKNERYSLLEVTRLPKKVDFLHHLPDQDAKNLKQAVLRTLPAKQCVMDRLPFTYSRYAGFIPSIMHKVQVAMVVDQLCETLLSRLQLKDRSLVATTIFSPSAGEDTDYNRLEFRGDSCLKYFTSLFLIATNLKFHEGILSHQKDHIVSNSSLATAAVQKGLAPFILTKAFTGAKWRPIYNSSLLQDEPPRTRTMSSKTLADVVEAILGISLLEGKALTCLEIFFPHISWSTALQASEILYKDYEKQVSLTAHLVQIDQLISYRFNLRSLLNEALTHPSHHGMNSSASYQRLEFLGDSVLDNIVTTVAFAHEPPIATVNLHLIRAALVNGHFLGYLCLTHFTSLQRSEPVIDNPERISTIKVSHPFYLWQAMRHASPAVRSAQEGCLARLETVHAELTIAFAKSYSYPWTLLARLEPPKFFSDLIESLLGAIYIDSRGSLIQCESFLEHLGLMPYLHRVMQDRVAILHPKEMLGQLSYQDTVKYILGKEGEEGSLKLACTVMLGERLLVQVGDGLSVMEVQTRAADAACKLLRAEGREIRNNMGYSNGPGGEKVGEQQEAGKEEEMAAREEEEVERDLDQEMDGTEMTGHDSDEYMTADE